MTTPREYFSFSFLSVLFGELIWQYSGQQMVALLPANALSQRDGAS